MPAILTEYRRKLEAKKASVRSEYKRLTRDGSSRSEVVHFLATKYQVSLVSIYNYLKS